MPFFKTIAIISSTVAGLCVLALPMWILGVPGTENQYARGWKMGLAVLLIYPVTWFLNYAPYFVMRNRVDEESRMRWQWVVSTIAVIVFLAAFFRLIQSFRTMS